jgi:myo-inositol-1(or 4)-monophosphatase
MRHRSGFALAIHPWLAEGRPREAGGGPAEYPTMAVTDIDLATRFEAAKAIALEAGTLQKQRFLDRTGVGRAYDFKGHQDYLTATDGEVERLVRDRFLSAFPTDAMMGEEEGGTLGDMTWIVDPIDGTANFARGIPHFCISIGLAIGLEPAIGVIYNPMADELYAARVGHGATLNGEPIHVTDIDRPERASVEMGWSARVSFSTHLDIVRRITDTGMRVRHGGSGSLAIAYVAAGRVDGFVEAHINSWDVLAGIVLVKEAGGIVNDFVGDGIGLTVGNEILAATPGIATLLSNVSGVRLG